MEEQSIAVPSSPIVSAPAPLPQPITDITQQPATLSTHVDNNVDNLQPATEEKKQEKSRNPSWFKPGQTGNPNGRPKKDWTWKDLLQEAAEEMMEVKKKDKNGNTVVTGRRALKELVARKLLTAAAGGNIQAANVLMNRMEGMPKQQIEQSGEVNLNINDMLGKVYGSTESDSTT